MSKRQSLLIFWQIVNFENDFKCCEKKPLTSSLRVFVRVDYITFLQLYCIRLALNTNGYVFVS